MTRGSHWVVAGAALGTVLLAGCDSSGGDQPSPSPTPSASSVSPSASPSSSPTPTPSASGSEIPAAAREQTPAGAEAYVEYFFDQFNVAWTKPQPGLIKSLSDPECQFCKKSEADSKDLAESQQQYSRDPIVLRDASAFGGAPLGQQFVSVDLTQNAAAITDANGATVRSVDEKRDTFYITLRWVEGAWRLLELEKTE